jgi:signal transduction histidine kinase/CheY-like chemotaxis protein
MAAFELLVYTGICIIAYFYPNAVTVVDSPSYIVTDIIVGFNAASISLGVTMFLHFRMYNEQQRQLEKAREEAVRLSEAKTDFLARMSHEIRTPINFILGTNELILRETESDEISEYAAGIQNSGGTLLGIISDILDMSKIESGNVELPVAEYRTADLIRELADIGSERSQRRGLYFSVQVADDMPSKLSGSYLAVKQVASNFLSNAAKYTDSGSVELRFDCKPDGGKILLKISVSDTGVGITKEHLESLFNPFFRADEYKVEGTGLGLAIAKELTERMGGKLFVESVLGKGSDFTAEIPQAVEDGAPLGDWRTTRTHTDGLPEGGSFIAPGGKILVVDDNAGNLQVVKSLLQRTLLQVDMVESGARCLDAVRESEYHVILLDYMMPDMNGEETLKRLQSDIPGFRTPVIALTADAIAGTKEKLLSAGFAAYLTKPVAWERLEASLLAFLPEELVLKSSAGADSWLTDKIKSELGNELAGFGVSLDTGLRYYSGDMPQYKNIAAIFTENSAKELKKVNAMLASGDWNALTHSVHSLKSSARGLGAMNLYRIAIALEQNCRDGNADYIRAACPLLLLVWERVSEGLTAFIKRMDGFAPSVSSATDGEAPASINALLMYIDNARLKPALLELDRLIAQTDDSEVAAVLEEIREAVRAIEFEKAEELLMAYLEQTERRVDTDE